MSTDNYYKLLSIAAVECGCCTRTNLLAGGLTSTTIERYRRHGLLKSVRSGVYVVPCLTNERTSYFTALAGLDRAAISLLSGGHVHELPVSRRQGDEVEITVPISDGGRSFPGVVVHRTRLPLEVDVVELDGLRVTSLARTVFDLASCLGPKRLRHVVQSAMIHRGLTEQELWSCYQPLVRRGVRGVGQLRRIMSDLFNDDPVPQSILEGQVETMLKDAGVSSFRRQYRPPWFDGIRGTVDFADPESRVILEVDGRSWHSSSQAMSDDRRRDRIAVSHDWVVLRVVAGEVSTRSSSVVDEIRTVLDSRTVNRAA